CCWTLTSRMTPHSSRVHGLVHDRLSGIESRIFRKIMRKRAPTARVVTCSATDIVLFEQRLVTRLVLVLQVVEKGAARRHELPEAKAGVIVLDVGLEMVGEVVDAFRQDSNLDLGRAGVAGFGGIGLDDFRFALRGNRHRQTLSLLRPELATSPVRLNTRLGMS